MIVHKWIKRNGDNFYLCNQACGMTSKKFSYRWKNVTCKNCLKQCKR